MTATVPTTPTTPRWPLVGRHQELDVLERAVADPACAAAVVVGPAGVGKTRVAVELLTHAQRAGHPVAKVSASRAAAALPLGAVAHLLATDETPMDDVALDPMHLLRRLQRALSASGQRRAVLLVDDAHHLDAASAALLAHAVAAGLAFVVMTVRAGAVLPDALALLAHGDDAVRVDIDDLHRESFDTLLHLVLGGPVERTTEVELWDATHGNALFVREVVLGAKAAGTLVEADGVWRRRGPLAGSPRLIDLVQSRLADLTGDALAAVELLALCQPIGIDEFELRVEHGVLEDLERSGQVVVVPDGRRQNVMLAHPLHADVIRQTLPKVRARSILLEFIDTVERRGARRREDAIRIATWRLDATGSADPDLLLTAARQARQVHDFSQVLRLSNAAILSRRDVASALLAGEALYELGSFDEAERVLADVAPLATADHDVVRVVAARTRNLFWGCLRTAEALAVNRAGADVVTTPAARNELLAGEASIEMFSGHPTRALELMESMRDDGDLRTRVERAIAEAPALAVSGRSEQAVRVATEGYADHAALGDQLAIAHPGTHVLTQVLALTEGGRLAEAAELAVAGAQVAAADRVPIAQIWFATNQARIALIEGRPVTARQHATEAVALSRTFGFDGPCRMALAALGAALALEGDGAAAAARVVEMERLAPEFGFLREESALAIAWTQVETGDPAAARDVLERAADQARSNGHLTSAAWLLHDLARLGGASVASVPLDELAKLCDGPLVAVRALHARALVASDPTLFDDATDEFDRLGMVLAAAEAAIGAATVYRKQGDSRRAQARTTRAAGFEERCEGAKTPGLVRTDSVVPLTRREREIALLAADGGSSKEIADRLFLSVRTVDNHLQNVYSKLGITNRTALREALGRE
jgi:DNA-binding CsgD family transcriptional regulator/tetratricopeptide (TPR) repeat protein